MKLQISALDIVETLLCDDFLKELKKAGRYSLEHGVESALRPYMRTIAWQPGAKGLVYGTRGAMMDGISPTDTTVIPDDGLEHLRIHFHHDENILVPSKGDLTTLFNDELSSWETHKSYAEYFSVRFRKISAIAKQTTTEIGILLFQLQQQLWQSGDCPSTCLQLDILDEQLEQDRLFYRSQEEVVRVLAESLNVAYFEIPQETLQNPTARSTFRNKMRNTLERALRNFTTDITVMNYELFSEDSRWQKVGERRKRQYLTRKTS